MAEPAKKTGKDEKKDKKSKTEKKEKKEKKDKKSGSATAKFASLLGDEERYTLGKKLGQGAFSVVKEATDKVTGKRVAVKVIQKNTVSGDDIRLLKREVAILKALDHPNITKLLEVYEDPQQFFLVLELVEGCQLLDKIIEYSEKDAAHISRQIVEAIQYIHTKGVAHRDLKPENLLSVGSGETETIKVADFGLSKNFGQEKMLTACGSPLYVAPEVLEGDANYGMEVDMWSMGVIIYVLLVGYAPFHGDTDPELFKKIMAADYKFGEGWEDISDSAKDLVKHLLLRDSKKRLTATQALEHPWLKRSTQLSNKQIQLQKMKEYVTKSKLKPAEANAAQAQTK